MRVLFAQPPLTIIAPLVYIGIAVFFHVAKEFP
jgi:hypothetical protein